MFLLSFEITRLVLILLQTQLSAKQTGAKASYSVPKVGLAVLYFEVENFNFQEGFFHRLTR